VADAMAAVADPWPDAVTVDTVGDRDTIVGRALAAVELQRVEGAPGTAREG
jgi:hypothetical protein